MHIGLLELLQVYHECPRAGYRLSFDESIMAIVFTAQISVMAWLEVVRGKGYLTAGDYSKDFCMDFTSHHDEVWGFGKTIRTEISKDGKWVKFNVAIPQNVEESRLPVPSKEGESRVLAAALSISVLATIFNLMPEEYYANPPFRQVLVFGTSLSPGGDYANFPASVYYSRLVTQWTEQAVDPALLAIAQSIDCANGWMFPSQINTNEYPLAEVEKHHEFYLRIESSHRVGFICDGTKYSSADFDNGYGASICNPDQPYDQLLCIVGLARLYEVVENHFLGNYV